MRSSGPRSASSRRTADRRPPGRGSAARSTSRLLDRLLALLEPVEVGVGEVVFARGEPGDSMLVIVRSHLGVSLPLVSGAAVHHSMPTITGAEFACDSNEVKTLGRHHPHRRRPDRRVHLLDGRGQNGTTFRLIHTANNGWGFTDQSGPRLASANSQLVPVGAIQALREETLQNDVIVDGPTGYVFAYVLDEGWRFLGTVADTKRSVGLGLGRMVSAARPVRNGGTPD